MKSFREYLSESKYILYHNSYTSAVQEAEKFAVNQGFTLDQEQLAQDIGLGPAKPKEGKTNKFSLDLYKNDKLQKKKLQVQIYNRGTNSNEYELNVYIN